MLFLSSLPMRYQPLHGDPQADTAASLWLEGSQAAGGGDGRIRSGDGRVREAGEGEETCWRERWGPAAGVTLSLSHV